MNHQFIIIRKQRTFNFEFNTLRCDMCHPCRQKIRNKCSLFIHFFFKFVNKKSCNYLITKQRKYLNLLIVVTYHKLLIFEEQFKATTSARTGQSRKKMCRLLVRNVSTIAKIKAPTALIAALTSEPKSDEGRESFMQMFSRFIEPAFHFSTPIEQWRANTSRLSQMNLLFLKSPSLTV
jgi:hypothetical protein